MQKISLERWQQAQQAEREFHDGQTYEDGRSHYADSYRQYFDYVGITPDNIAGKSIMEVGCADFPALSYIDGYLVGFIVEPIASPYLEKCVSENPHLILLKNTVEDIKLPIVTEVWIFNVMQHIIDPLLFISKLKESANVIRYFEPINTELNVCHPHAYTLEFFKEHFGDAKHYPFNNDAVNFHQHECAYGVWEKY